LSGEKLKPSWLVRWFKAYFSRFEEAAADGALREADTPAGVVPVDYHYFKFHSYFGGGGRTGPADPQHGNHLSLPLVRCRRVCRRGEWIGRSSLSATTTSNCGI